MMPRRSKHPSEATRPSVVVARAAAAFSICVWTACGGVATDATDASDAGDADASASTDGGGRTDGAESDGATLRDGAVTDGPAPSDGGTPDAAYPCNPGSGPSGGVPPAYATCNVESECVLIDIGCYCGAQPVEGVASTFGGAAAACEAAHAKSCALGCPIMEGYSTQDGKTPTSRSTVKVRCVARDGGPKRCESYVP